jgi:hypothetical protein
MRATTLATTALLVGVAATAARPQGPPVPRPGPEHEILKRDEGVWDATIEMTPGPGLPPMTMTGTETSTLVGGRWLISEFHSEMMGQPFEGHGITGWDPEKEAYVGVWADTMSTELTQSESTFEHETNTMTGWMEMRNPTGEKGKARTVEEWPDETTRIIRIYPTMDAAEPFMTMTYKKRK